jgi:hypothetical protein
MDRIRDHAGLYVGREPDDRLSLWDLTTAKRQPLERVERSWRGVVMDTYALEKVTGWTPDLTPSPDSPLFKWRVLAQNTPPRTIAAATKDREKRHETGETCDVISNRCIGVIHLRIGAAG